MLYAMGALFTAGYRGLHLLFYPPCPILGEGLLNMNILSLLAFLEDEVVCSVCFLTLFYWESSGALGLINILTLCQRNEHSLPSDENIHKSQEEELPVEGQGSESEVLTSALHSTGAVLVQP